MEGEQAHGTSLCTTRSTNEVLLKPILRMNFFIAYFLNIKDVPSCFYGQEKKRKDEWETKGVLDTGGKAGTLRRNHKINGNKQS